MGLISNNNKGKVTTDTLNKDELEHLLWALSESTFRGKDVHLLGGIVTKLTNQRDAK